MVLSNRHDDNGRRMQDSGSAPGMRFLRDLSDGVRYRRYRMHERIPATLLLPG